MWQATIKDWLVPRARKVGPGRAEESPHNGWVWANSKEPLSFPRALLGLLAPLHPTLRVVLEALKGKEDRGCDLAHSKGLCLLHTTSAGGTKATTAMTFTR